MIRRFNLLRNVGQFDSVNVGANVQNERLTIVYAENGRGKTTLTAILRSYATGDPMPIMERHRLAAPNPPHIILECAGGPPAAIFQNDAWNRTRSNMAIFDDDFVNKNVYSGLSIEPEHRQNLHELIIGAQGVALNEQLQQLVSQVEEHNTRLRTKSAAIPTAERGALSVDEFCALPAQADIDTAIQTAERQLSAAREQDPIRNTSIFDNLSLPGFNIEELEQVLQQDLPSLDAAAEARVQIHLAGLGQNGEAWISDGMRHLPPEDTDDATAVICPFCAQDLAGSPVIHHYRAYFSDAYDSLKKTISSALAATKLTHGGDLPATFERAVRIIGERRQFWSRFCEVPDVILDTAAIVRDWQTAREAVIAALTTKQAAPLERMMLTAEARATVNAYEIQRDAVTTLNQQLQQANVSIRAVKEQAAVGNTTILAADVARLKAVKARYTPDTAMLCDEYLAEKAAKGNTEQLRNHAREALDQYRTAVFPTYEASINQYLQRFNAGFRLGSVTSANTRGGSTCTYNVIINDMPVAIARREPTPGEPSFRCTLSAGDRNTLALAFFFASLDQCPNLASKVVVIDDPVSSLDEHRSLTTVQEVRRLAERTTQVIVFSHSKPFLCRIWEGAPQDMRAALEVVRHGSGSTVRAWDVNQDCISEHDRRHSLMREYLATNTPNSREVAGSIRPLLEAFLRVACPEHFQPGTMLGPFRIRCTQRIGTAHEILNAAQTQELRDLIEYANRFHHDTNPAWEVETINEVELAGFVRRALNFAKC